MTKRIIYTVINIAIVAVLFLFFFINEDSDSSLLLVMAVVAVGLILLLLIVFQIILLIAYTLKSKRNFDFLLVFTCFYSLVLIIPYTLSVISLVEIQKTLVEMQQELTSGIGKEMYEGMINDNPFWGMHTLCLIPLLIQAGIFILRMKKNQQNIAVL